MKICWRLLDVENDTYLNIMNFLLVWIMRNRMMMLNEMMKPMLVNAYMLRDDDLLVIVYIQLLLKLININGGYPLYCC